MIHIHSHFVTIYTDNETLYSVFGSFTALPSTLNAFDGNYGNIISVYFYITKQTDKAQNLPSPHHIYIREVNGLYSVGTIRNQKFQQIESALLTKVQDTVVQAYNDAVERKRKHEKQPEIDYTDLLGNL